MTITLTRSDHVGVSVIRIAGKFLGDPETTGVFNVGLDDVIRSSRSIVIDMAGVTMINSSGLGLLLDGQKRADAAGLRLVLLNTSNRIDSVLYVSRLDKMFKSYADEQAAIRAARATDDSA